MAPTWLWPSHDEINDFPDPLGFVDEWKPWIGVMADDTLPAHAEVFVRELVQNSWDAIQEQTKGRPQAEVATRGVEFRDVVLDVARARRFKAALGLDDHARRYKSMKDAHRDSTRLDDSEVATGHDGELRLLIVRERWGKGLSGPWWTGGLADVVSHMRVALIQTISEKYRPGQGGSWGHGKRGIANGSKCRTLAVYSCSAPMKGDPEPDGTPVTRKFIGVSYWKKHDIAGRAHVGLGLLGGSRTSHAAASAWNDFQPLLNKAADDLIANLSIPGLEARSAKRDEDLGLTYIIVEPSFDLEHLRLAVLRNWWPLMLSHPGAIKIYDAQDRELPCDPRDHKPLEAFLHAHGLASGRETPEAKTELHEEIRARHQDHQDPLVAGRLGLTSSMGEGGWSMAPETETCHVALVRNDMVIAYQKFPRGKRRNPPYVRGVFLVDEGPNSSEACKALRMSEPHLHNEWKTEVGDAATPKKYALFAKAVLDGIGGWVNDLRDRLQAAKPASSYSFPEFSELWKERTSVTRRQGKDPERETDKRPWSITYPERPKVTYVPGPVPSVSLTALVRLELKDGQDPREVSIRLGWAVMENSAPKLDPSLALQVLEVPPGFKSVGRAEGTYAGKLTSAPVTFRWKSRAYPDYWIVVPDPSVTEARKVAKRSARKRSS